MRCRQRRGSEWESACLLRHQMWVCHDEFLFNSKLNHSISCPTQMLQRVSLAWHATSGSLGPRTWRFRAKWKLILARTWATSGTLTTRQRRSKYRVPDTIANHRADPAYSLTNRWLLWTTELFFVTPRMQQGRRTNPASFTSLQQVYNFDFRFQLNTIQLSAHSNVRLQLQTCVNVM